MNWMKIMNNESLKGKDQEMFKRFQVCYIRMMRILIRGKKPTRELEDYYIATRDLFRKEGMSKDVLKLLGYFSRVKI